MGSQGASVLLVDDEPRLRAQRVMVELPPPALDEWGLAAALSDYAKTFEEQTGTAPGGRPDRRPSRVRPLRPGQHAPAARDGRRSWQVHSRPGHGTTVTATLPLTLN